MDLETSLPMLYPLRYHIDHLAFRSLSTQSASLQSVKFFYEFWRQKYGVSFCYSFYSSDHNPDIAVGEMPAFWMYLENGHNVQSNVLSLTRVTKANSLTHTVRVRAVIHFISFNSQRSLCPTHQFILFFRKSIRSSLTNIQSTNHHCTLTRCNDWLRIQPDILGPFWHCKKYGIQNIWKASKIKHTLLLESLPSQG